MEQPLDLIDEETIESRLIYLSTKRSTSILLNGDYKSKVAYNLGAMIDFDDPNITKILVSIPYASLVNSVYQMNETNNMLVYSILGEGVVQVYFPEGNYTQSTFIQEFQTQMPSEFSITFNPKTSKFTITHSTTQFTFYEDSTIDSIMGFSGTFTSASVVGVQTLVMNRVVNFLPTPIFYITTDTIYSGQSLGREGVPLFSNIIAAIPNTSRNNQAIVYSNPTDEFELKSRFHSQMILGIVNDEGTYLNFHGISSFFCLRFRIFRKFQKLGGTMAQMVSRSTNLRINAEEMRLEEEQRDE
jgi:hypothetical protein